MGESIDPTLLKIIGIVVTTVIALFIYRLASAPGKPPAVRVITIGLLVLAIALVLMA